MAITHESFFGSDVLRPLVSLISKSEKAREKLKVGTWQHTMLCENVKALRLALALLNEEGVAFSQVELRDGLHGINEIIRRVEKVRVTFAAGTAHHSLQRNRLNALRGAGTRIRAELKK